MRIERSRSLKLVNIKQHFQFTILLLLIACRLPAQTLGGNTVFNFLRLSHSPQLSALGGVNVSYMANDISLAINNPGLLRPSMHAQLAANFNAMIDGIKAYHVSTAYHHKPLNTNFAVGLTYLDYGNIEQTDAAGNLLGQFRPRDWALQISASRSYLEKWQYGATVKFINSDYGAYKSNGIAVDIGILYYDSARLFSASLLAKNMGSQLRKYGGTTADDLPFDLQAGISKRFSRSPFGVSLTAHHLHRFDIRYNDGLLNDANNKQFFLDKLFRHFVLAGNIYLGSRVVVDAGYNYLRRKELNIGNSGNGLTGFSLGISLLLDKMQVHYARSQYQSNTAYNQFGLNLALNRL